MSKNKFNDLVSMLTSYEKNSTEDNRIQVIIYLMDVLKLNADDVRYYDETLKDGKATELIEYLTGASVLLGSMVSHVSIELVNEEYKLLLTTNSDRQFIISNIKLDELED